MKIVMLLERVKWLCIDGGNIFLETPTTIKQREKMVCKETKN
jgi:hypothetical protein